MAAGQICEDAARLNWRAAPFISIAIAIAICWVRGLRAGSLQRVLSSLWAEWTEPTRKAHGERASNGAQDGRLHSPVALCFRDWPRVSRPRRSFGPRADSPPNGEEEEEAGKQMESRLNCASPST